MAITLCFLATGMSYHSLSYDSRVPHNSISVMVKELCEAIFEEHGDEVMVNPTTPNGWRQLSHKFYAKWNILHACSSIDGKYITKRLHPTQAQCSTIISFFSPSSSWA